MNNATTLLTVLFVLFVASNVSAQSPRRRGSGRPAASKPATTQPAPQPTPTPAPAETPAAPKAPVLLATVNGQNVTTADIDQRARAEVDGLDEKDRKSVV